MPGGRCSCGAATGKYLSSGSGKSLDFVAFKKADGQKWDIVHRTVKVDGTPAAGGAKSVINLVAPELEVRQFEGYLQKAFSVYVKNPVGGNATFIVIQDNVTFELCVVKIQHLEAYFS